MLASVFVQKYKAAAAEGSVLELNLRMLCEAVPELSAFAHEKLEHAENALVAQFRNDLSGEEQSLLTACRQLRNKVLHCDFRAARETLTQAGGSPGDADVRILRIDEAKDSATQITAALGKGIDQLQAVSDTVSTRDGTVFGWLLELGSAGDFERASEVFQRAVGILDRLAKLHSNREVARVRGL